jgi:hypothetical protein
MELLGQSGMLAWRATEDGFAADLPEGMDREAPAWVIRFERG